MSKASEWARDAEVANRIIQARPVFTRDWVSADLAMADYDTLAMDVWFKGAGRTAKVPPAEWVAFAEWILDAFSEERSDEAPDGVAPAGSGSRESRTTAGAAAGHEGAPTGGESGEQISTRGASA